MHVNDIREKENFLKGVKILFYYLIFLRFSLSSFNKRNELKDVIKTVPREKT